MRKIFAYVFIISLGFLAIFNFTSASSQSFGGTVAETKADAIKRAEEAGYKCEVRGKTTKIKLTSGASLDFYIPSSVKSATGNELSKDQQFLGNRSGAYSTITCTKKDSDGKKVYKQVKLRKVNYYGNQ